MSTEEETCKWTRDQYVDEYETTCGRAFLFSDYENTVADQEFSFCPFCGKKIEAIEPPAEEEDEKEDY